MKASNATARAVASWVVLTCALGAFLVRTIAADIFDDVGDWLWGGISSIYDAIRSFVVGMVRHWISLVQDTIQWVIESLTNVIHFFAAQAYGLFQAVWGALSWWVGVLWSAIQAAENFAEWLVGHVVDALNAAVSWLFGAIEAVAGALYRAVSDITSWVVNNIWGPLSSLLDDVFQFVTHDIPAWVNGLVNNVWCFIKDVAASIGGIAATVVDAALGPFKTLLAAGLLAIKWIVWMALHPFDWFTTLLADFFAHGSGWLLGQISAGIQKNADTVDHWLARFFE